MSENKHFIIFISLVRSTGASHHSLSWFHVK
jgi:hypothetical protein